MSRPRRTRIELPIAQLLPNLITVAAICAGLTAIRLAFEGWFEAAVLLILVASVLDGLDGRLARLLKSESAMGAELDSLADFLNFGIAPGLLIYLWAFQDVHNASWVAVLFYVLCCVLRLARFNIGNRNKTDDAPSVYFVGVPTPAGASLVMLPLYLSFMWKDAPHWPPLLIGLYMILVGLLMISRLPTWSGKSTTVYRENVPFLFIGSVCIVAALLSFPWATLVFLDVIYLFGIVWTWRIHSTAVKED